MNEATAAALGKRGVVCLPTPVPESAIAAMDDVDILLAKAPSLLERIRRCVGEIALLKAPSDEYDVSHSEPQWPERIYVSVPQSSLVRDLRVAEAIVHEAMHLNLSNLERIQPLFKGQSELFSPWRMSLRPVSGVFHGLYVFTCVARFFQSFVLPEEVDEVRRDFMKRRLAQVSDDIALVPIPELRQCLTDSGEAILKQLFVN
ncbi:hypothetical protein ABENE_07695 [Asticcacaulis benevestitus DSM 16100 = ATCC BAA-896]|uniref:HEXXH motif domain-containing protein n=1 Tax=Asticcacaulis benevestitus DSM 16100 = ATCC BAA-896 TaxID=1121022 RepID=V4Q3T1_9CAUL|nr:hypothetical protein ABENE_07695 [Asticcacaulis benevestitus DSM 16100 = ATCC BAA-896]